jgi:hypothetical protein
MSSYFHTSHRAWLLSANSNVNVVFKPFKTCLLFLLVCIFSRISNEAKYFFGCTRTEEFERKCVFLGSANTTASKYLIFAEFYRLQKNSFAVNHMTDFYSLFKSGHLSGYRYVGLGEELIKNARFLLVQNTNSGKIYQNNHKMYQMAIKYTN